MYQIDEGDGIVLHEYQFENKLFGTFEVQGNVLNSVYELNDNELTFEIISGKQIESDDEVKNYTVDFLQRSRMFRVE